MSAGATGRPPKISAMHNMGAILKQNRDGFLSGSYADVVEYYAESSPRITRQAYPHSRSPSEPQLQLHHDSEEVLKHTKAWVNGLVMGLRLCPFTRNADLAGIPPGHIRYEVSTATTIEGMHADWFDSVGRFADTDEEEVASLMLVFPQLTVDFVRFRIFQHLQSPLFDENVLDYLQEMEFHPEYDYAVEEDEEFLKQHEGFISKPGAVDRYTRRSPFPMFQLLRTQMIGRVKKGDNFIFRQVVLDGAKRLAEVGENKLQAMLDARDWTELKSKEQQRIAVSIVH